MVSDGVRTRHELTGIYEKGRPAYASDAVPSVVQCARADTSDHPSAKPLALMRYLIGKFSTPGDPFAGSGTTLLAAKIPKRATAAWSSMPVPYVARMAQGTMCRRGPLWHRQANPIGAVDVDLCAPLL